MSTPIPTFEPLSFNSGDTLSWTKSFPDYPSSLWTLKYYFVNATVGNVTTATSSGSDYAITLANSVTTLFPTGKLNWSAVVTNGTETHTLAQGVMDVLINLAIQGTYDARSFVRKMYDLLSAAVEKRLPTGLENFTINGKSLSTMSNAELINQWEKFKGYVDQENNAEKINQGKKSKNNIFVRFGRGI